MVDVEPASSRVPDDEAEEAEVKTRRWSWVDAAIAIGLGVAAFLLRRHYPPDGLFFDDAWQALAAVEGSFRQLLTVGQTQPGFGFDLMVWSRLFGDDAATLVTPAMIAGALGPPVLYLVLRGFAFARSIAVLLAAALTVSVTHIIYSGRVKAYTGEVLIVLLLAVVVPWLARRSWRISTAAAWFAGSMLLASFSSFALLASCAAGVVLVLHPKSDRRMRIGAVAAQAFGVLVLLLAEERTHNAPQLNSYFASEEAFLDVNLNPFGMIGELWRHLVRIVSAFPGGPSWGLGLLVAAATVGLFATALRGPRAVAARFMIVMVLIAIAGAFAHRIPFGPRVFRASLWLIPVVALGLAVVLEWVRRAVAGRGSAARIGFDAVAVACALLLLWSAVGVRRPYPPASLAATREVMERIGPDDAVLITLPTIYSFALNADTPVRLRATPDRLQGIKPVFADDRLHFVDWLSRAQRRELVDALKDVDRVYVVHSKNDPAGYRKYRIDLAVLMTQQGFEETSTETVRRATITVWERK